MKPDEISSFNFNWLYSIITRDRNISTIAEINGFSLTVYIPNYASIITHVGQQLPPPNLTSTDFPFKSQLY